jgi:AcrR family transcriptional regulator
VVEELPLMSTSGPPFTPAQTSALESIALGESFSSIARAAGIHRSTLYHWIHTQPAFAAAVEQARESYAGRLCDDLRDLARFALTRLRDLLTNPDTPPSVQLKAALAVLNRPHFPQPGWHLPERVESPAARQTLDTLAGLHAEDRLLRMAETIARRQTVPPAGRPSAAPAAPAAPPPGTPRGAPCPCGSRLKFKRCCGRNAPAQYSNAA